MLKTANHRISCRTKCMKVIRPDGPAGVRPAKQNFFERMPNHLKIILILVFILLCYGLVFFCTSARARAKAPALASISSFVVAQEQTDMRMAGRPFQVEPPHQQVPSS